VIFENLVESAYELRVSEGSSVLRVYDQIGAGGGETILAFDSNSQWQYPDKADNSA
jgi:hypothetical protein